MRILGAGNDDRAGYTVAGGGDMTGDGRPEIVVGAFLAGGLGRIDARRDLSRRRHRRTAATCGWATSAPSVKRWVGSQAQEQSGYAVDSADVNGDGTREIVSRRAASRRTAAATAARCTWSTP